MRNPDIVKFEDRNAFMLWNGGFGSGTVKLYTKKGRAWELVDTFKGAMSGCEYGVYSK